MKYNSDAHHRRSIRLAGYDYSQQGGYFVTICAKNRECLFGKIDNGEMKLNEAGRMINAWWIKLFEKFPEIKMDAYVVMPNHFHGIIQIVGAIPCNRPNSDMCPQRGENVVSPLHF